MTVPAWEVPFEAIGKVLLALPEALTKIGDAVNAVETDLIPLVTSLTVMLSAGSMAITEKGLNISLDATVMSDFLATLAKVKSLVGDAKNAVTAKG